MLHLHPACVALLDATEAECRLSPDNSTLEQRQVALSARLVAELVWEEKGYPRFADEPNPTR